MNRGWIALTISTIIFDSWRTYLKIRNLLSIRRMREAPLGMNDLITEEDYNKFRKTQLDSNVLATISIVFGLCVKLIKQLTYYDKLIWDFTAAYGTSLSLRAVLHPTFDRFVSECTKAPIGAYMIWHRAAYRMHFGEVFMRSMIDIALGTVYTGSLAFGFIQITDRFGILALPVLMMILCSIGIYLFIFYITKVLTYISVPLEDDEVGRNLKALADRVGYPHEKIRITVTDTASQEHNVHYYGILGYDMVLLARRLLRILIPVQVTAMVTQELGHWKFRHQTKSSFFGMVEVSGYCCASMMSYGDVAVNKIFGFKKYESHPYIPLYLTTRYIWPMCRKSFNGLCNLIRRVFVFQADDYASDQGLTAPLRSGLLVTAATLRNLPMFDSWHSAWYKGEPTVLERVARLNSRFPKLNVTFQPMSSVDPSLAPIDINPSDESSKKSSLEAAEDGKHSEATNQKEHLDGNDQLRMVFGEQILLVASPERHSESSQAEESKSPQTNPSKFAIYGKNYSENRHSTESSDFEQKKKAKKQPKGSSIVKQEPQQPSETAGSTEIQELRRRSSIQDEQ